MGFITSLTRIALTRSFKPFRFRSDGTGELSYAENENLGLYVHLPFCRRICTFCPYCKVVYDEQVAKDYVESLLEEIRMVGVLKSGGRSDHLARKQVTSLYFGGGTPALLTEHIGTIIETLNKYFDIREGIGLELHPADVTVEKLQALKDAGVTKISIGVQSFQDEFASCIGREPVNYERMGEALKKVPFETVSMDFIFALPGQTLECITKDIETAFSSGANHIAIYPFIDFTFTDRKFVKMGAKEKKSLLYGIVAYCESKGYVRDSIWTFSKAGNSKYSSMTRENFLGFGCSATTLLKGQFRINTFDIGTYRARIAEGKLPTALVLDFTERQRMIYYLFWTAYTMRIDEKAFKSFFGKSLMDMYGWEIILMRLMGMVRKEMDHWVMTTRGSYYYHYYEHFYTLSYIDRMWHLMGQEALPEELVIR